MLTVSISGCNKTGFECPTCEGELSSDTILLCVHCGQKFNYFDVHPIALDPKVAKRKQEIRDFMNPENPQNRDSAGGMDKTLDEMRKAAADEFARKKDAKKN